MTKGDIKKEQQRNSNEPQLTQQWWITFNCYSPLGSPFQSVKPPSWDSFTRRYFHRLQRLIYKTKLLSLEIKISEPVGTTLAFTLPRPVYFCVASPLLRWKIPPNCMPRTRTKNHVALGLETPRRKVQLAEKSAGVTASTIDRATSLAGTFKFRTTVRLDRGERELPLRRNGAFIISKKQVPPRRVDTRYHFFLFWLDRRVTETKIGPLHRGMISPT